MNVKGMKVAAIVADGFEQKEPDGPIEALKKEGVQVEILAQDDEHLAHIHGVNHFEKGPGAKGDKTIDRANPDGDDGLLVPGGAVSPDTMRQSKKHHDLVKRLVVDRNLVTSRKPDDIPEFSKRSSRSSRRSGRGR